jgi:hypothetical protein
VVLVNARNESRVNELTLTRRRFFKPRHRLFWRFGGNGY